MHRWHYSFQDLWVNQKYTELNTLRTKDFFQRKTFIQYLYIKGNNMAKSGFLLDVTFKLLLFFKDNSFNIHLTFIQHSFNSTTDFSITQLLIVLRSLIKLNYRDTFQFRGQLKLLPHNRSPIIINIVAKL